MRLAEEHADKRTETNACDCISRRDAIDALEREKTYSAVYEYGYTQTDYFKQYNMGLTDGIKALNKLPSAQPEIVLCKDCKHRYVDGDNVRFNVCELNHNRVQADDWFCADAERREE